MQTFNQFRFRVPSYTLNKTRRLIRLRFVAFLTYTTMHPAPERASMTSFTALSNAGLSYFKIRRAPLPHVRLLHVDDQQRLTHVSAPPSADLVLVFHALVARLRLPEPPAYEVRVVCHENLRPIEQGMIDSLVPLVPEPVHETHLPVMASSFQPSKTVYGRLRAPGLFPSMNGAQACQA